MKNDEIAVQMKISEKKQTMQSEYITYKRVENIHPFIIVLLIPTELFELRQKMLILKALIFGCLHNIEPI